MLTHIAIYNEATQEVVTLLDMARDMSGVTKDRPSGEVVTRARKYLERSSKFIR